MSTEQDIISEFIDEMRAQGCEPAQASSIVTAEPTGGKWPRYQLAGDRPRQLNGFYRLKITPDARGELRGIGTFGTRRDNKGHNFSSKGAGPGKYTPEERAAWKAQRDADAKAHEALVDAMQEQAKDNALKLWRSAAPARADHPYIVRKKISPEGLRQVGDELLSPMFADNALWNLQTITAQGDKFFSFRIGDEWSEGGRASGCYFPIAGAAPGDMSIVAICEGVATGKSIREATGLPVFCAYTSGNLRAVARDVRLRYPAARIVICSDHDQWRFLGKRRPKDIKASEVPGDSDSWAIWRAEGRLENIGLRLAQQTGGDVMGWIVTPDIPDNDVEKRTDFNDWYLQVGAEPVRDKILAALSVAPARETGLGSDPSPPQDAKATTDAEAGDAGPREFAPLDVYEKDFYQSDVQRLYHPALPTINKNWEAELSCNDEGVLRGNSKNNVALFIENHRDYVGMLVYDEFAHEKVVARAPPWQEEDKFVPRTMRDSDITNLAMHMERKGLFPKFHDLARIVEAIILKSAKNPAQEYFNRIVWDGTPRLATWLRDVCGCVSDDPEYLAAIGTKWLCAGVRRVRRPGTKFDHVLLLEGRQRSGKSTVFSELATIHGRAYFDDTIKARDLPLDKTVPKLQGVLIIELAEMTGFARMSPDEMKQIISTSKDRIVKKYANEASTMPRQFIMAGTLNPLAPYLNDDTGGTRFWPARCGEINLELLAQIKEQLWAEAAHREAAGEELYVKDELFRKAERAQEDRLRVLPWQPDLEQLARGKHHVKYEEIWEKLGMHERAKRTRQASDDIGKIMTALGFEFSRKRINGEREYAWFKNPAQRSLQIGDEAEEQDNSYQVGEEIKF